MRAESLEITRRRGSRRRFTREDIWVRRFESSQLYWTFKLQLVCPIGSIAEQHCMVRYSYPAEGNNVDALVGSDVKYTVKVGG